MDKGRQLGSRIYLVVLHFFFHGWDLNQLFLKSTLYTLQAPPSLFGEGVRG